MKFFAPLALLALSSATHAAPLNHEAPTGVDEAKMTQTDQLLFRTNLADFQKAFDAKNPNTLDWSSNACDKAPDNPFSFQFKIACQRYDFGTRNYKDQHRFTDHNKDVIDDNFKKDLYDQCESQKHSTICRRAADIYYAAVKVFGPDTD